MIIDIPFTRKGYSTSVRLIGPISQSLKYVLHLICSQERHRFRLRKSVIKSELETAEVTRYQYSF